MKTKLWILFFCVGSSLLGVPAFAIPSATIEGGGVTGGGTGTVRRENANELFLTDLEKVPFLWYFPGDNQDFLAEFPELDPMLDAIQENHWYLGFYLRREITQRLKYALTENDLKTVRTHGVDDLTVYKVSRGREQVQLGIRRGDKVYISKRDLALVHNQQHRACFLVHEAAHSLIPFTDKNGKFAGDRQSRLMSLVNILCHLRKGPGQIRLSSKRLMNNLIGNGSIIQSNPEVFKSYRDRLDYLFKNHETTDPVEVFQSSREILFGDNRDIINAVREEDQEYLMGLKLEAASQIESALNSLDIPEEKIQTYFSSFLISLHDQHRYEENDSIEENKKRLSWPGFVPYAKRGELKKVMKKLLDKGVTLPQTPEIEKAYKRYLEDENEELADLFHDLIQKISITSFLDCSGHGHTAYNLSKMFSNALQRLLSYHVKDYKAGGQVLSGKCNLFELSGLIGLNSKKHHNDLIRILNEDPNSFFAVSESEMHLFLYSYYKNRFNDSSEHYVKVKGSPAAYSVLNKEIRTYKGDLNRNSPQIEKMNIILEFLHRHPEYLDRVVLEVVETNEQGDRNSSSRKFTMRQILRWVAEEPEFIWPSFTKTLGIVEDIRPELTEVLAEMVSWQKAKEICELRGERLPTVREYAAWLSLNPKGGRTRGISDTRKSHDYQYIKGSDSSGNIEEFYFSPRGYDRSEQGLDGSPYLWSSSVSDSGEVYVLYTKSGELLPYPTGAEFAYGVRCVQLD